MTEIVLPDGRTALIDDVDAGRLLGFAWRIKHGYIVRAEWRDGRSVDVYLHREVLGDRPGFVVDHISGDTLDNRRSSLRHVTSAGNARNRRASGSSGFKGVTLHRRTGRWQASIQEAGRSHYLGLFDSPEDAARAYDHAAASRWGAEARLNFAEALP